ncbi:MAG TPA: tetratricopeptide repeat protein [Chloroflexota bacterium]|nr:tetratricopeptide repeat protein [Chloroflexota bacterium]
MVNPQAGQALELFQQGNGLAQQGRLQDAAQCFRQALELEPRLVEAQSNLGAALKLLGQLEEAEVELRAAIAAKPDYLDARLNLGSMLEAQEKLAEALKVFDDVTQLWPQEPAPWVALGHVQLSLSMFDEAEASCRRALERGTAQAAQAHSNLGAALHQQGRVEEAEAAYRRALAADRNFAVAHANLGTLLETVQRFEDAVSAQERAVALEPANPDRHFNLGNALLARGRLELAEACYRQALALRPDYAKAYSNLLMTVQYRADLSPEDIFREHLGFGAVVHRAARPALVHENQPDPERLLRVGYISADFRGHAVASFLTHALEAHDREQVEVVCYSNSPRTDDVTRRIQAAADRWREVHALADAETVELIRQDGIDVLVDLAGHTGDNRLPVLAAKPAPVQVTWLGYPDTTGLAEVDYRITDAWADPAGRSDQLHTEGLIRLPNGFSAYEPPSDAPEVSPLPAAANGYVTFGSFNNFNKLSEECLSLWARILASLPGSRLLLKCSQLDDAAIRDELLEWFTAHGIAANRLDLFGAVASQREHLAHYSRMDVALDPFPYNGATTSCEALWMGVPVIALEGDRHAGRVGLSMLTRVGLEYLVALGHEEYRAKAVALAGNVARLERLRSTLRETMRQSSLTDGRQLVRDLEAEFRKIWRTWCASAQAGRQL